MPLSANDPAPLPFKVTLPVGVQLFKSVEVYTVHAELGSALLTLPMLKENVFPEVPPVKVGELSCGRFGSPVTFT